MKSRWLKIALNSLLVFIIALVSALDSNHRNASWITILHLESKFDSLFSIKPLLSAVLALILAFLPSNGSIVWPKQYLLHVRKDILSHIRSHVFSNGIGSNRITLLSQASKLKSLRYELRRKWKWVRSKEADREGAFFRKGFYIDVEARESLEDSSYHSRSHFFVDAQDPSKCDGVAAYVIRSSRSVYEVGLPDINDIAIVNKEDPQQTHTDYRKVAKYMEKCRILHQSTLRRLARKSTGFYCVSVSNPQGRPIGALMIDSCDSNFDLTEHTRSQIDGYAALLSKLY